MIDYLDVHPTNWIRVSFFHKQFFESQIRGDLGVFLIIYIYCMYIPSGKLRVCELENGPVEIVSFLIDSMVDLSMVFGDCGPGGVTRGARAIG